MSVEAEALLAVVVVTLVSGGSGWALLRLIAAAYEHERRDSGEDE